MGESQIKSQSNLDETLALALDINSTSLLNQAVCLCVFDSQIENLFLLNLNDIIKKP